MRYQDNVEPNSIEAMIHFVKSRERMLAILKKDAPTILRIPISFVRLLAKNEANPNRPRQAMLIEIAENIA